MTPLASAISGALIHFVWQGSIVGLSLWAVLFALRKKSADSRYVAGCVALAVMAALPVVTTWVLYAAATPTAGAAAPMIASWTLPFEGGFDAAGRAALLERLQAWALPLWSIGVFAFSLRLLLGYRHAFQLRRRGREAGPGVVEVVERLQVVMAIRRRIRVLISGMSDSPSVVGWLRPVVLLPTATVMGLTPLQLEAIVAHELGHIKRHDYLVNMFQMVVETLLFYHPAVWWASRKLRIERELCCDDLAVRFSGSALRYARALTTLEKLRLRAPSTVMAGTGGPLLYRIQRLVGVSTRDYGPSRLPSLLAVALGVLCFALNVTWMRGQDAPGVKVDFGSTSVIHRTAVQYPEAAKRQRITGTVQLEVKLDSAGSVADARVLTGPEELRKAALESVLNWHFSSGAARSTRQIGISFSEQGTEVQVNDNEPTNVEALKRKIAEMEAAARQAESDFRRAGVIRTEDFLRDEAVRELGELELKLNDRNAELDKRQTMELQRRAESVKSLLETIRSTGGGGRGSPLSGRVLKSISTPGMSDSVRNELLFRLPIREGDTLSPALLEETSAAVRGYDEHLRVVFNLGGDGQAELRISSSERR
jgi:TonB family protein